MPSPRFRYSVRPNSGVAIYRQIVEQVVALVAGGYLKSGDLLPSVRDVARELTINPMTVSKAYSILEMDGVVDRVRGTGMRIAAPSNKQPVSERQEQLRELAETLATRARQLGLSEAQVQSVLRRAWKQNKQPR